MPKTSISAAIVNYRTPDLTIKCVSSLIEQGICNPADIVILDNQSGDESYDILVANFPDCIVIQAEVNRGYGDGLNIAVSRAPQEFVLCLNPDTYFENNQVVGLLDVFRKNSDIAIIGLDLHYPSGERQFSARQSYTYLDILLRRSALGRLGIAQKRINAHLMKQAWDGGIFDADWVIGTGFLIRAEAFHQVMGMDTDFFMYMEDVDLCLRLRQQGWRVVAAPGVKLIHDHQRESASGIFSRAAKRHLASINVFRHKHRIPLFRRL
jgi:N-acetylglucosaminyl-diphospho-decaprenol L-rhamnosyltransferase